MVNPCTLIVSKETFSDLKATIASVDEICDRGWTFFVPKINNDISQILSIFFDSEIDLFDVPILAIVIV